MKVDSIEHILMCAENKIEQAKSYQNMYERARQKHIQCHCLMCRPELPIDLGLTPEDIGDDLLIKDKRKLHGVTI